MELHKKEVRNYTIFYIYEYTNLINDKKYVGQTSNLNRRIREHQSCSFNPKSINYNSKIHQAIRKYGYINFKIDILEIITDVQNYDLVNEQERYWIKKEKSLITQWGYNILEGGRNAWRSFLTPNDVLSLKKMIKDETPYSIIQQFYPISKTFISDINNGKYFFDDKEKYPLCKYRISKDIYDALIEDLIKPELTFKELAIRYNLSESTVKKFNYGSLQPGYYKNGYPIRKITPQQYKRLLIKDYLLNTNYNQKEIVILTNTSDETVRRVNIGSIDKDPNLIYPLR